jgi:hypothetical protein
MQQVSAKEKAPPPGRKMARSARRRLTQALRIPRSASIVTV